MAIFYIDPENGNDANDGLSFANRVQTFASGLTAARIAPGDQVRMIASPDPASVGNATWTNGSRTVTLAAAKTVTIDNGETAWTASANVTATANTTRKQGATSAQLVVAAAFTTGKIAYRTLPATLDLSAYQQVSLWFSTSQAQSSALYELRLCSDTTGDVTVAALPFTLADGAAVSFVASAWRTLVLNYGAALGATINSVALYAVTDPGSVTLRLDNIVACLPASDPTAITHNHLIGKNTTGEPEWYPILSIDGTSIELGGAHTATQAAPPRAYSGTSETVTTYVQRPLYSGVAFTTGRAWSESGTAAAPFELTGGWSRTDMATQSGQTWLHGSHICTAFINLSGRPWVNIRNIGVAYFTTGIADTNTSSGAMELDLLGVVGCVNGFSMDISWGVNAKLGNVVGCANGIRGDAFSLRGTPKIAARRITGCHDSTGAAVYTMGVSNARMILDVARIDNGASYAVRAANSPKGGYTDVLNCSFDNFALNTVLLPYIGHVRMVNCSLDSYTFNNGTTGTDETVAFTNYNGDPNDHRVYNRLWTYQTETTVRHTASGFAWKLSVTLSAGSLTTLTPALIPLAQVVVDAGAAVTLKCWTRRTDATLPCGIMVRGGYITGVPDDVRTAMSAAADTWEELTITVTPTQAGIIELFGYAYDVLASVYFDDLTITQA